MRPVDEGAGRPVPMSVVEGVRELSAEERKAAQRVVESLRVRLPEHPVSALEEHVAAAFAEYRDCRVRDFLPILVERSVLTRLTS